MRLLIHQGTDDLAPHNLFVYCVGLDVLAVEVQTASGASNRVRASDKRREPGDEMISVAAKWPIAAPRRSRCNPNIDVRFTGAGNAGPTCVVADLTGI